MDRVPAAVQLHRSPFVIFLLNEQDQNAKSFRGPFSLRVHMHRLPIVFLTGASALCSACFVSMKIKIERSSVVSARCPRPTSSGGSGLLKP